MVKFLVVDRPSAYNAILGRAALNELEAITSTAHLKMKFPTRKEWEKSEVTNGQHVNATILPSKSCRKSPISEKGLRREANSNQCLENRWKNWRSSRSAIPRRNQGRIAITPRAKDGIGGIPAKKR
jgi:hypothetical protein